jgi:anti-sigma regulatory factor (Ser/Thr protein kinase)
MIVPVEESSQISEARRSGLRMAESLGWDETSAGRLAIVLTELSTNLVKHASRGRIHLRVDDNGAGEPGIEILSVDQGPGIPDVDQSLADGYSTTGTTGTGLGAIARIADEFDIYSLPKLGACMVARVFPGRVRKAVARTFIVGAARAPVHGETECGDNWAFRDSGDRTILMMADGLGHGPGAAEASNAAVQVVRNATQLAPTALLEQIHHALRSTRGAAVAVASIDNSAGQVHFAGAGNISAVVLSPSTYQQMISHNGTAGHNVRKFQEFVYPWTRTSSIVLHSDGITTSWRLEAYPGILQRDPALVAAVLLRDASRGRDDACIVVGRDRR